MKRKAVCNLRLHGFFRHFLRLRNGGQKVWFVVEFAAKCVFEFELDLLIGRNQQSLVRGQFSSVLQSSQLFAVDGLGAFILALKPLSLFAGLPVFEEGDSLSISFHLNLAAEELQVV